MRGTQAEVTATWVSDILFRLTIRSPTGIRAAAEVLCNTGSSLGGFATEASANIASKSPMLDGDGNMLVFAAGNDEDREERCARSTRATLTAPLALVCRYQSEPFWCDRHGIHTDQEKPSLDLVDLSDSFARSAQDAAIVVPVHLPYGQIGAVTFRPREVDRDDLADQFRRYGDLLGLFARKFVSTYVKMMDKQQWNPADHLLSKREIECLRWAAVGKTDGQIASILSRSCATVRFHIHNAGIKLNAVNRCQAVFKAGQLGYLDH
jgi:LuxR family transcriptional regulator, quorum-sensing system regulator CciR